MIDASIDRDYAALERAQGEAAAGREVPPRRRTSGTLAELPVRPPSAVADFAGGTPPAEADTAMLLPPSEPPCAADAPLAHLRAARLGLIAVVLLLATFALIRHWRSRT